MTPDPRFDPYPHYAQMRAESPVHFNPELQVWEIYGYHDVQTVLDDPSTFSSDVFEMQILSTMDPPRHTQLRKLVARSFTPKLIAKLEPSIQAMTDELLDRIASTGRMDVIRDLASPLPITVIAELLGLPVADREKFKEWSIPVLRVAEMELKGQAPEPRLVEIVEQLNAYLQALVVERERRPREDLISGLAAVGADGECMTLQEVTSTCRLLLIAGFETTIQLIGNTTHLLLAHPDGMALVRADAGLLPSAIEESLRYHAPFLFFARKATRNVTLGGQLIRAGQRIMIFNASGNRDEAAFPDADRFDVRRTPNRHLSFGHGIHHCVGVGLARLEAKVGIGSLLLRFPDLRLDEEEPAEPLASRLMYGWGTLPVRFTPA